MHTYIFYTINKKATDLYWTTDTAILAINTMLLIFSLNICIFAAYVWSQEEQRNMGAWSFVRPRFENLCSTKVSCQLLAFTQWDAGSTMISCTPLDWEHTILPTIFSLVSDLEAICFWETQNYVQFNFKMTQFLPISPKCNIPHFQSFFDSFLPEPQETVNILSVIVGYSLSWRPHI